MRGFLVGSLVLIVLYVGFQPGSSTAAAAGSSWLVSGLRRAISPDVAGIPQRGGPAAGAEVPNSKSGGYERTTPYPWQLPRTA